MIVYIKEYPFHKGMEAEYSVGEKMIRLLHGGIETFPVDVMVTPANGFFKPELRTKNVQWALYESGGKRGFDLVEKYTAMFRKQMEEQGSTYLMFPATSTIASDAGTLPASYIFHTVSMHAPEGQIYDVIAGSVKSSLELADKITGRDANAFNLRILDGEKVYEDIKSINFPLLGTGLFNLDPSEVSYRMVETMAEYLEGETNLKEVGLVLFSRDHYNTAKERIDLMDL